MQLAEFYTAELRLCQPHVLTTPSAFSRGSHSPHLPCLPHKHVFALLLFEINHFTVIEPINLALLAFGEMSLTS